MNQNMMEKANQIIKNAANANLGVIDGDGYPVVMAMSLTNTENIAEVYMTTTLDSNKAKCLQNNNKASVCFSTNEHNITLVGVAEIITDQEIKRKCWQNWFVEVYPGGETDPTYCVIRFTAKRVSLFIDGEVAAFNL